MLTLFSIIFLAIAFFSLQIHYSRPNLSWIRLHLLLERRWFILLLLYFVVLTNHLLLTGLVGSGVGVFDGLISTVYCVEESSKHDSFQVPITNTLPTINVKHTVDGITVLGEGIKALSRTFNDYKTAAIILATGTGTATILNALPPGAPKITLAIALPTLVAATTLADKGMSIIEKRNNNNLETVQSSTLETMNSTEDLNYINSSFEDLNPFNALILSILLFALVAIYCLLAFTVSFIIKELKLESKPFVINRPFLARIVKTYTSTNRIVNYLLLILTWLALLGILYVTIYLHAHLPTDL